MNDNIEADFRRVNDKNVPTRFLPDTSVEIVGHYVPESPPGHVLFDFDGTLSLIREGWPEIMVPMMVEHLVATGTDEDPDDLRCVCEHFVTELTGKQTIYQMIRLSEEVTLRGGTASDPIAYKNEYHDRLTRHIESRREALRTEAVSPDELVVPGTFAVLEALRARGADLYLASGTDEKYVREEVELLQLGEYFGRHVYGAQDDYRSFSKKKVIHRILEDNRIEGSALLGFGDGYVEIRNVRDAGGTAVAVASDEARRSGRPDPWKRERLITAGAHVVIPDYAEVSQLMEWLWSAGGKSSYPGL